MAEGEKAGTMTVPRPAPDQVTIAVCGEDGAQAWTIGSKKTLGEPGIMSSMLDFLAEAQGMVREEKARGGGQEGPA